MKKIALLIALILLNVHPATADVLEVQPYDRIMGSKDAPVTIIEYSSLACPHCADFNGKILPVLKEKYMDSGKLRLIARNFPTNAAALRAAMLTMCVPEDKYYTFLKVLFASQTKWALSFDYEENLKKIARVGGVSEETFNACMKDEALEKKVLSIRQEADEGLEIKATPTFFVNGQKVEGAQPVEVFSKIIDAELEKRQIPQ